MADDAASLVVQMRVDQARFEKEMSKIARDATRAADKVERGFAAANQNAARSFGQVSTAANRGFAQAQQGAGRASQAVQGLSFQLNDIATSLSGGASPFQVMMQQGSQVAEVMQGIRAGGGSIGATVVGAFTSMLNPISLVSFGLIALGGYALKYGMEMWNAGKKSEEVLKAEQQLIDGVIKKWGDLLPTLKEIEEARQKVTEQRDKREATEIRAKEQYEGLSEALDSIRVQFEEVIGLMQAAGETDAAVKLTDDWAGLEKKIADGTATVEDLQAAVTALTAYYDQTGSPAVKTLIDSLNAQIKAMGTASTAANKLREDAARATPEQLKFNAAIKGMQEVAKAQLSEVDQLIEKYREAIAAASKLEDRQQGVMEKRATEEFVAGRARIETQGFASGSADIELTRAMLKSKAANKEIAASLDNLTDEAVRSFGKLFAILPESARITSGVRTREKQAQLYADYKAGRGGLAAKHSRHEVGAALDIGQGVDMETLRKAVDKTGELETLKGRSYAIDKVHVQLKGTQKKADDEAFQSAERQAEQQGRALEQLNEMIGSQQQEIALKEQINAINANGALTEDQRAVAIAKATAEAAKAAEVEKLINQAREAGLVITPQLIAQYNALAAAKVNAIVTDKQLAIAQRDTAKSTEEQKRAADALNDAYRNIAKTAFSGFVNDLRNGVKAGDAFANMLDRVIDGLINMAIEGMFAKQAVGGAGGGSGLFGFLGKFLGIGMHAGGVVGKDATFARPVSPTAFVGAHRYQRGGVAGLLPGEVPAILHRGEVVIPRGAVGKGAAGPGTVNNNQQIEINVDNEGNTLVKQGGETAFGQLLNKAVQQVLVQESRPGGLLRQVPGA